MPKKNCRRKKRKGGEKEKRGLRRPRGAEVLKCVPSTVKVPYFNAWMLARQAFCWGVEPGKRQVLYCTFWLPRAGQRTSNPKPLASQRSGNTKQKMRRKRAIQGGTIMEMKLTGPFLLLCSPIQFTAFPCLWQKDRQSEREDK